MKKDKVKDVAGFFLLVISVLFLIQRIRALDVDMGKLLTPVNTAMFVAMPFLSVVTIFFNSYCWRINLQLFSKKKLAANKAFRAYAKSNLMKYLPGNIGHYAGRQLFGVNMGIRQIELAAASFSEIVYSAFAMVVCAVLFSASAVVQALWEQITGEMLSFAGIVICAMLLLCCLAICFFRKNRYFEAMQKLLRTPVFWYVMVVSFLVFSFGSMLMSLEYVIVLGQYETLHFSRMLLVMSANYAATFIGFITPGVPGGIGVREVVLLEILTPFFSEEVIILSAVICRCIMILGDLAAAFISRMFIDGAESLDMDGQQG